MILEGLTILILTMLLADIGAGWGKTKRTAGAIRAISSRIESNIGGQ